MRAPPLRRSARRFERIGKRSIDVAAGEEEIAPARSGRPGGGRSPRASQAARPPRKHHAPGGQSVGEAGDRRDAAPAFRRKRLERGFEPRRRVLDRHRDAVAIGEKPVERAIEGAENRRRRRRRRCHEMHGQRRGSSARRVRCRGPARPRSPKGRPESTRRGVRDRFGHARTRGSARRCGPNSSATSLPLEPQRHAVALKIRARADPRMRARNFQTGVRIRSPAPPARTISCKDFAREPRRGCLRRAIERGQRQRPPQPLHRRAFGREARDRRLGRSRKEPPSRPNSPQSSRESRAVWGRGATTAAGRRWASDASVRRWRNRRKRRPGSASSRHSPRAPTASTSESAAVHAEMSGKLPVSTSRPSVSS